jgi:hypothetical protein
MDRTAVAYLDHDPPPSRLPGPPEGLAGSAQGRPEPPPIQSRGSSEPGRRPPSQNRPTPDVIVRSRWHQPTRDYLARRTEGTSKKEILRGLKRYLAREVFAVLHQLAEQARQPLLDMYRSVWNRPTSVPPGSATARSPTPASAGGTSRWTDGRTFNPAGWRHTPLASVRSAPASQPKRREPHAPPSSRRACQAAIPQRSSRGPDRHGCTSAIARPPASPNASHRTIPATDRPSRRIGLPALPTALRRNVDLGPCLQASVHERYHDVIALIAPSRGSLPHKPQ